MLKNGQTFFKNLAVLSYHFFEYQNCFFLPTHTAHPEHLFQYIVRHEYQII